MSTGNPKCLSINPEDIIDFTLFKDTVRGKKIQQGSTWKNTAELWSLKCMKKGPSHENTCPQTVYSRIQKKVQDAFSFQYSTRRQGFGDRRELSEVKLHENELDREMPEMRKEEKKTKKHNRRNKKKKNQQRQREAKRTLGKLASLMWRASLATSNAKGKDKGRKHIRARGGLRTDS